MLSLGCSYIYFASASEVIIIINDSIYPAVSKASRTGNKVSCQPNDCVISVSGFRLHRLA